MMRPSVFIAMPVTAPVCPSSDTRRFAATTGCAASRSFLQAGAARATSLAWGIITRMWRIKSSGNSSRVFTGPWTVVQRMRSATFITIESAR